MGYRHGVIGGCVAVLNADPFVGVAVEWPFAPQYNRAVFGGELEVSLG
jgi:hypothetical protein